MKIKIERGSEAPRILEVERLVSTVGLGDGCDVVLAPSSSSERLGMLIQQGEGFSFRPLHVPSGVFLGGVEVEGMIEWPQGGQLEILDFNLSWMGDGSEAPLAPPPPPPPPPPSNPSSGGYKAGALSAYGNALQNLPNPSQEGVELALSQKRSLGAAEVELARKLEQARNKAEANPGLPELPTKEEAEDLITSYRQPAPQPGKTKDVLKHFFNHLDLTVLTRPPQERKRVLADGLRRALAEVKGLDERDPLYGKLDRELRSAGPFKKLLADEEVRGLMIRDRGLVYVDRGQGFDKPQLSFFNPAHAYWTLDRLLLSAGVTMNWEQGRRSFRLDEQWGGRAFLPQTSWQGAYVVMRRRVEERPSWSMDGEDWNDLEASIHASENLLLVASDAEQALHLSHWLLNRVQETGQVMILSDEGGQEGNPRHLTVHRGDAPLVEWLEWSEGMDLLGRLNTDPNLTDMALLRALTHQKRKWWQILVAKDATSALEKLELDLLLEHQGTDPELVRRLILGAFHSVVGIDGKSISGKHLELKASCPHHDGTWKLRPSSED